MAEYIIKHKGMQDEYYLKDVTKERLKTPEPVHSHKGRKWKCVESREEITPRGENVATWTQDETQAKYFQNRKDAEKLIEKWPKVLRFASVIEA